MILIHYIGDTNLSPIENIIDEIKQSSDNTSASNIWKETELRDIDELAKIVMKKEASVRYLERYFKTHPEKYDQCFAGKALTSTMAKLRERVRNLKNKVKK